MHAFRGRTGGWLPVALIAASCLLSAGCMSFTVPGEIHDLNQEFNFLKHHLGQMPPPAPDPIAGEPAADDVVTSVAQADAPEA